MTHFFYVLVRSCVTNYLTKLLFSLSNHVFFAAGGFIIIRNYYTKVFLCGYILHKLTLVAKIWHFINNILPPWSNIHKFMKLVYSPLCFDSVTRSSI